MLYRSGDHNTVEILKVNRGTLLHSIQLPRRMPDRMRPRKCRLDPGNESRLCTKFGAIDLINSLGGVILRS